MCDCRLLVAIILGPFVLAGWLWRHDGDLTLVGGRTWVVVKRKSWWRQ